MLNTADSKAVRKEQIKIIDTALISYAELNNEQLEAIHSILYNEISCILGPPGTGKTKLLTLSAVLNNYLLKFDSRAKTSRVGIIAPTNEAANNLIEALHQIGIYPGLAVRVGYGEKITGIARTYTPESMVNQETDPDRKIERMREVTKRAQIIVSTVASAYDKFPDLIYDLLIVDEGSLVRRADIPSVLARLKNLRKMAIIGDPFQLKPIDECEFLRESILSHLTMKNETGLIPYENPIALKEQFRMNPVICGLVSNLFYEPNKIELRSHPKTFNKFLSKSDFERYKLKDPLIEQILEPEKGIVFIDTSELDITEKFNFYTYYNEVEGEISRYIDYFAKLLYPEDSRATLTPYSGQERLLSHRTHSRFQPKTIDSVQGREMDIVILSFIRDNPGGRIGFLEDLGRLNVGLSRARKKLILIGDISTLSGYEIYQRLIRYIEQLPSSRSVILTLKQADIYKIKEMLWEVNHDTNNCNIKDS